MACVPAPCRRARVFVRPFAFAPLSAPRNESIPSTPCKLPCLCGCTGRIVLGRSSECGLKARASKLFIRRMATAAIAGQQLLLQGQVPGASLLARSQKSAKCLVWMAAHFFHQNRRGELFPCVANCVSPPLWAAESMLTARAAWAGAPVCSREQAAPWEGGRPCLCGQSAAVRADRRKLALCNWAHAV